MSVLNYFFCFLQICLVQIYFPLLTNVAMCSPIVRCVYDMYNVPYDLWMNGTMIYLTIAYFGYFPLEFRTVTHQMRLKTMKVWDKAKNNVHADIRMKYLACWLVEGSHSPFGFVGSFHPTNKPDISFRSQNSHVLGLFLNCKIRLTLYVM